VRHVHAVDQDLPARGRFQPGDHAQGGGFATARWPEDGGQAALGDDEVDALHHQRRSAAAIAFADLFELATKTKDKDIAKFAAEAILIYEGKQND
jgi:hypothetical protein